MTILPTIGKKVKREIAKAERRIEAVTAKVSADATKGIALELLNRFQSRIKFPIHLRVGNGDSWLRGESGSDEERRYDNLWDAIQAASIPSSLGIDPDRDYRSTPEQIRFCVNCMRRFPELIDLAWLSYELDSLPGRPDLGDIVPTVPPYRP